jgi:uncharacterized NAD(P)/FAD-binding protein YdhS
MDALRPHTAAIWQRLSARDRARFARSVRPYWEVLRHRAPRESLAMLARLRESGQLTQRLGELLACEPRPEHCDVTLRVRGAGEVRERFRAIVRCTGPALTLAESKTPLTAALLDAGHAQADASGLGLRMSPDAQLIEANGAPSQRLYALGQPCRAARWETTAVPDISRDAAALARVLLRP